MLKVSKSIFIFIPPPPPPPTTPTLPIHARGLPSPPHHPSNHMGGIHRPPQVITSTRNTILPYSSSYSPSYSSSYHHHYHHLPPTYPIPVVVVSYQPGSHFDSFYCSGQHYRAEKPAPLTVSHLAEYSDSSSGSSSSDSSSSSGRRRMMKGRKARVGLHSILQ